MSDSRFVSASFILALLLGCYLAHASASGFSRQEKAVEVVFPPQSSSRKMDMAMADFGRPKYGGFLIGKLVYPTEDPRSRPASQPSIRCSGDVPCQYGCSDFQEATPPFTIPKVPGQFNIMMVDRGPDDADPPCWLISKAYYAQLAGADAVLIVNRESDALITAVVPEEEDVVQLLDKLTISAAMIGKADGDFLKGLYKANTHVSVRISWSNIIPQSSKVHMEFWTNSNDECGTLCDEQREFIQDMKPVAIALQQAGLLEFEPHYLLWTCPLGSEESDVCTSSCILGGRYCAPDPDGSISEGYSGKDVLEANIRQLCFARVSARSGSPWLWWGFAEALYNDCSTEKGKFDHACAEQVFSTRGGPQLMDGHGLNEWRDCISKTEYPDKVTKVSTVLEEELEAQHGWGKEPSVAILPTIRINHVQYRGTLEYTSVMRALCAAFPDDAEPTVCNEKWISEDECEVGGPGYMQCRVGDPETNGRTRCINTFNGYKCECRQGWVSARNPETGEEVCEDINECLATSIPMRDKNCSCPRCACINLPGTFKCTGELPDKCTAGNDYNGCWRAKMEDGKVHHACKDGIFSYKQRASKGLLQPGETWASCACPACFSTVASPDSPEKACKANCPMSMCSAAQGMCLPEPVPAGPVPKPSPSGGSTGWVGTAFAVLLTATLTCLLLYAIYSRYLHQRMHSEMRDIMAQYMPLGDETDASRRGPGAGLSDGPDPEAAHQPFQPSSTYAAPVLPPSVTGGEEGGAGGLTTGERTQRRPAGSAQIPLSSFKAPAQAQQAPQPQQAEQQQLPLVGGEDKGVEAGGGRPVVFDGDSSQGPL